MTTRNAEAATGAFDHMAEARGEQERRHARLRGKVAIITGAGGGVGVGMAHRFTSAGMHVVLTDVDPDRAATAAQAINREGGHASAVRLDVTDEHEVRSVIEDTATKFGRLDVLCNNAAVIPLTPFEDVSPEEWRRVLAINLDGPFYCLRAAVQVMRERPIDPMTGCRGKIINVSSPGAQSASADLLTYGVSKAGIDHLTQSAAAALTARAISVTTLYPGPVWEGMQHYLTSGHDQLSRLTPGTAARKKLATWPTGRWQPQDDTGDIAVFIAAYPGLGLNGRTVVAHPMVYPFLEAYLDLENGKT